MQLRENIFTTLLLAIGLIIHHITPGILGGMKFDFLLIFMTVAIILNPKFKNTLLTGMLAGILSAMTTSFPGGQIPNLIDKMLASITIFLLIHLFMRLKDNKIIIALIGALATFVSGTVFLASASIIVGLPLPMMAMMTSIVIPTAAVNTVGTVFIYNTVKIALRRRGIKLVNQES